MKSLLICFLLLPLLLLATLSDCAPPVAPAAPARIAQTQTLLETGIPDWSNAEILAWEDSHGGFHGDGMLYAAIRFPDNRLDTSLAQDPAWQPLPLSDALHWMVYGGTNAKGIGRSPLMHAVDGKPEPLFPPVERGFYRFIDRHSACTDPADETAALARASYNFSLAVYDADSQILYFCALDT